LGTLLNSYVTLVMGEEENKETNVKATIDAVTGLVKAVPVYEDAIQPAAKQIGKSLETITKTVNIALAPFKVLVWGYEKIGEFISTKVSDKLKNVPEENIITPPLHVAGPAIEALRYAGHDPNLRELYANLLASAMDKETIHEAHPSFVEIIKNLSSDEAILIQAFCIQEDYPLLDVQARKEKEFKFIIPNYSHFHKIVKVQRDDLITTYLENFCRLGILEIVRDRVYPSPIIHEQLESDNELDQVKSEIEETGYTVVFKRKVIILTEFGKLFVKSVVKEK